MQTSDLERSHRVGPKLDKQGKRLVRPIIVRFAKERTHDGVYHARFRLKDFNAQRPLEKAFVNEDLTRASLAPHSRLTRASLAPHSRLTRASLAPHSRLTRASLAAEARSLRKSGKITDMSTYNGNILIENEQNEIVQVRAIFS